ncbi:hypothetical protein ACWD4F_27700 [Streptomyces aureus]
MALSALWLMLISDPLEVLVGLGCALVGAIGPLLTVVFVAASAITAGAVLRVAARVFVGAGERPAAADTYETKGKREQPESRGRLGRVPMTMTAVPAALLGGAPDS